MIVCKECLKEFKSINALGRHNSRVHGINKKETYVTEAGDIEKWDGGSIDPEYIKMVKANIKRLKELEI